MEHGTARAQAGEGTAARARPVRTAVVVALVFVLGLWAVGGWALVSYERAEERDGVARLRAEATGDAALAEQLVTDQIDLLDALTQAESIRSGDATRVATFFDRVEPARIGFTGGLAWVDASGRALVVSGEADPGSVSFADRDWFEGARSGRPFVGEAVVGRVYGAPTVTMAVPIRDDLGQVVGVLAGSFLLDRDGRIAHALGIDRRGRYVVDRAGRLVISDRPIDRLENVPAGAQPAIPLASSTGSATGAVDAHGRSDRVVAWSTVANAGWTMVRSESEAALYAPERRNLVVGLLLLLGAGAAAVAIAWLIGRRVQRRYDASAAATRRAEAEQARLARVAAVMAGISASPTREEVARLLVDEGLPIFGANGGRIAVRDGEDPTRLVTLYTTGWSKPGLGRWATGKVDAARPAGRAVSTGRPVFVGGDELESAFPDLAPQMRSAGHNAWAALPLLDGTDAFGALAVSFADPNALDETTRTQLGLLAERASSALVRASRQELEHEATVAFQASVLPPAPESIAGVSIEARYRPGHEIFGVGGDWYDTVPLPDHRVMIIVGDVVGRGIGAAATMGQLRTAAHTLASSCPPAELLARLDSIARHDPAARGTSMLALLIDAGAFTVEYSSAGHPPAMLVDTSGVVTMLEDARGSLLGLENRARRSVTADLGNVCSIVGYTDGLVERRGESLDVGLDRLARALASGGGKPVPADDVLLACLAGSPARDDAVLLCVHFALGEAPQPPLFVVGGTPARTAAP